MKMNQNQHIVLNRSFAGVSSEMDSGKFRNIFRNSCEFRLEIEAEWRPQK